MYPLHAYDFHGLIMYALNWSSRRPGAGGFGPRQYNSDFFFNFPPYTRVGGIFN